MLTARPDKVRVTATPRAKSRAFLQPHDQATMSRDNTVTSTAAAESIDGSKCSVPLQCSRQTISRKCFVAQTRQVHSETTRQKYRNKAGLPRLCF